MPLMLDLETLGTTPGSVVLQVAAVEFTADYSVTRSFSAVLNREEQTYRGLVENPGTLEWWTGVQPLVAWNAVTLDPQPVEASLRRFCEFVGDYRDRVYCQGASFDFPILSELLRTFGLPIPWKFWMERDTRTVYDEYRFDYKAAGLPTAHEAEADCRAQIQLLRLARGSK